MRAPNAPNVGVFVLLVCFRTDGIDRIYGFSDASATRSVHAIPASGLKVSTKRKKARTCPGLLVSRMWISVGGEAVELACAAGCDEACRRAIAAHMGRI